MQIICLGAARTVTGSCYLVEPSPQESFLVNCGLFQGSRQIEHRNWLTPPYKPKQLGAVFITHAHIDHSGLVPRLVRRGYRGPILASQATCELLRILWLDSAHIQEMEADWQSRRNHRQGKKGVEPLYITEDAQRAIELLRPVNMEEAVEPMPGVRAHFIVGFQAQGTPGRAAVAEAFPLVAQERCPQVRFQMPRYKEVLTLEPLSPQAMTVDHRAAALARRARAAMARLVDLARGLDHPESMGPRHLEQWERAIAALEALPKPGQE